MKTPLREAGNLEERQVSVHGILVMASILSSEDEPSRWYGKHLQGTSLIPSPLLNLSHTDEAGRTGAWMSLKVGSNFSGGCVQPARDRSCDSQCFQKASLPALAGSHGSMCYSTKPPPDTSAPCKPSSMFSAGRKQFRKV